jgi:predicted DNA-binding protein (MmcQ/YjbR family)
VNIESFRAFCLSKAGVSEEFPFGEDVLVFKVKGKVFALTSLQTFGSINLKCDPEIAIELRERYEAVLPGYHMNKKHWNTILMDGSLPDKLVQQWVDDSYNLVVNSLKKTGQVKLKR